MKTHGYIFAMIASTSVLSACGGGGGGADPTVSRAGNPTSDQVLTKNAGNAAQALVDGETLRASERTSSGISRNFGEQTAVAAADTTARVSRNSSGALTLEVAGETFVFTPDDLQDDGYGYHSGNAGIWAWSAESMAAQLDPANERDSLVFDYFVDLPGNRGQSGLVVVGTETDASDLAALPSATYSGWARVRVAPTEGFENWNSAVSDARGDLNMAANFGAGTIYGSMTNLQQRQPRNVDPTESWTDIGGSLALNETAIRGNGFSGDVTADSAFQAGIGTVDAGSSYSGTFFGTAAGEVAGGISLSGSSADGGTPYVGWGVFQGGRN